VQDARTPVAEPDADEGRMRRTYASVIVVQVIVLAALWAFQEYFSH
jgi:hypothetical protein